MLINRVDSPRTRAPQRTSPRASEAPRDSYVASGEAPPVDLQRLARTLRSTPPGRNRVEKMVDEATRPRPETELGASLRRELRQHWDEAERAWGEAREVAARGPGRRRTPDGGWETVQQLPNGATEVTTRDREGRSRTTRFDETGRVHVSDTAPDGTRSTLYRNGTQLHRDETMYDVTEDGRVVRGQKGKFDVVAPDGTLSGSPPPPSPEERAAGLERARANSEIPGLRKSLADLKDPHGRPVTGEGVTIGLLDDNDEFLGTVGGHGKLVGGVAADGTTGVAPGATLSPYAVQRGGSLESATRTGPLQPTLPPDLPDDPVALDRALRETPPPMVDLATHRLNQILADPGRDPKMRVLNLTLGSVRSQYYDNLWKLLQSPNHPNLRREVLGDLSGEDSLTPEVRKRLAAYADQRLLDPQSAYQQSLGRFRETSQRYEEQGIALVVSAGNAMHTWDQASPGSELSDFARSPHVISVGASDTRGRPGPGQRSSHGIWDMSARGEGPGGYNPTVLAPGHEQVAHGDQFGSGTSLSAPFVSGVIALMLQANPNLTVADIRRILQETASPLSGVDGRSQGAGTINPEEAVRRARG